MLVKKGGHRSRSRAGGAVATLAEILALRKIVVNLLYGERTGEPLDDGRMRELIEAADAEKLGKAVERLRGVSSNGEHL